MTTILKKLRKNSLSKHSKLCEDWVGNEEPVCEGVTFYVKYLGSIVVEKSSGEDVTSDAIRTIISMAKCKDKRLTRVSLTITIEGIKMVEISSSETLFEVSVYKISYCSADATYDHVFAFIATNANDSLECHAFLCPKKKMAQAATLTIAQAFNLAYENWQANQERRRRKKEARDLSRGRDSSRNRVRNNESRSGSGNRRHLRTSSTVPQHATNNNDTKCSTAMISKDDQEEEEGGSLLIDLSSPVKDSKQEAWVAFDDEEKQETGHTNKEGVTQQPQGETDKMDESFKWLSQLQSPIPILQKLPPSAAGLEFGALAGSPATASPYGSPLHGANLTPSVLMTPIGSPIHHAGGHGLSSSGAMLRKISGQFVGGGPPPLSMSALASELTGDQTTGHSQGLMIGSPSRYPSHDHAVTASPPTSMFYLEGSHASPQRHISAMSGPHAPQVMAASAAARFGLDASNNNAASPLAKTGTPQRSTAMAINTSWPSSPSSGKQ